MSTATAPVVFTDVDLDDQTPMSDAERALLTFVGLNPTPRPEPDRDRWGRYALPHPATGKKQGWTRATTLAKAIDDTYNLERWAQRMAAVGFATMPALVNAVAEVDDPTGTGKPDVDALVDRAKQVAGATLGASLGTAMHTITELHDLGLLDMASMPATYVPDVMAYAEALAAAGMVTSPEWIERIVLCPPLGAAGTLDRIVTLPDGRNVIFDVKTAKDMSYSWVATSIQLALYANAEVLVPLTGGAYEAMPDVDKTMGIVAHMPVGTGTCTLHEVDLTVGWELAQLCHTVRERRKTKGLAKVHKPPRPQSKGLQCPPDVDAIDTPDEIVSAEVAGTTPPTSENVGASSGPTTAAPGQPEVAAPAATSGADLNDERTAWITKRLLDLKASDPARFQQFRADRLARCPEVPAKPPWTNEDIDAIDAVLSPHEPAFDVVDPAKVAAREEAAKPAEAAPEPPATPTWGSDPAGCALATDIDTEGVKASLASLKVDHPERHRRMQSWVADAKTQARPFMHGPHHRGLSQRQWHLCRAALACVRNLWDAPKGYGTHEQRTRAALTIVTGDDLQPTWTTGAVLGSLTIDQAEELVTTVELFAAGDRPTRAAVKALAAV